MSPMAAKKKPKIKAKPKRPAAKPQRKTKLASKPAAKRVPPKAKRAAAALKQAKPRAALARPQTADKQAETAQPIVVSPAPLHLVRPGLQKRADLLPIGIVRVTDGHQLIEESTFYSAPGRDEYVERWTARGYTCRFTPTNN
jgi:hypothetical protein